MKKYPLQQRLCALGFLLAAFGCGAGSGAGSSGTGPEGKLVITGSSTLAPLIGDIARRFETIHSGARIDVQTGGSSRGIADVRRGTADIGMASRALLSSEADLAALPIAKDGVGMIVHEKNPLAALSDRQVVDIYTGRIRNWRELGGPDAPISVVNKAEGRATLEVFLRHFSLDNPSIRPHVVIGDNQEGIKTVAGNPHAIAYVSIGAAEYEARQGVPIRLLPAGGSAASTENLKSGLYPISRPLTLVTRKQPDGLVRDFLKYCRSSEVHDLIEAHSFVPLER